MRNMCLDSRSAGVLLRRIGVPVHRAISDGSTLLPGGAKLTFRQPQRDWFIGGYAHDGSDVREAVAIIAGER